MLSLKLPKQATLPTKLNHLYQWICHHWMTIFCCSLLLYLLAQKNITLQLTLQNDRLTIPTTHQKPSPPPLKAALPIAKKPLNPKQQKQMAYVQRFAKVAQGEMHQYGIPASIKLAQGLLESQAGNSPLATKNNNHFGIKCFSRSCHKGHCRNFSDDSHKDFFRVYQTAWESYRAHSEFLQSSRYRHLQTSAKNYRDWANGLQQAGYATDPNYAKKLIRLIEDLGLDKYDIVG